MQVAEIGQCLFNKVSYYVHHCQHRIYNLPLFNQPLADEPPMTAMDDWAGLLAPYTNLGHIMQVVSSLAYHIHGVCQSGKFKSA